MNDRFFSMLCCGAVATMMGAGMAHGETLLMQRVQQEHAMHAPHRGMSMKQVERSFGAPASKLAAAGGDSPRHPVIHRWVYPDYTVYFERNIVIDSVATRASSTELGPKATTHR
ncbi:MAG TPA: hypothetical protein VFN13_09150 [Rudaea sp.]|nr:hypothetical protein [Rudaea sp.]